jgi:hypothetical protein
MTHRKKYGTGFVIGAAGAAAEPSLSWAELAVVPTPVPVPAAVLCIVSSQRMLRKKSANVKRIILCISIRDSKRSQR